MEPGILRLLNWYVADGWIDGWVDSGKVGPKDKGNNKWWMDKQMGQWVDLPQGTSFPVLRSLCKHTLVAGLKEEHGESVRKTASL